ncbi:hypothetical protein [Rhodococcus sp. BE178]|uniref:hypothetical protein n=1 Tax=Rhodococcus sp. BE178 TaxID=2817737 RepID=UPI003D1972F5
MPVGVRRPVHRQEAERPRRHGAEVTGQDQRGAGSGGDAGGSRGTEQLQPVGVDRIGPQLDVEDAQPDRHRAGAGQQCARRSGPPGHQRGGDGRNRESGHHGDQGRATHCGDASAVRRPCHRRQGARSDPDRTDRRGRDGGDRQLPSDAGRRPDGGLAPGRIGVGYCGHRARLGWGFHPRDAIS